MLSSTRVLGFQLVTRNTQRVKPLQLRASTQELVFNEEEVLSTVGSPTELPDSLEDAAELAARACLHLTKISSRNRCRVDFDTSVGDETYTTLKSSTSFMQKFTSALCYASIPGLMQHRQDQVMSLIKAKAELATILTAESGSSGEELPSNADRLEELKTIVDAGGIIEPWKGDVVRIFFPDEGSAALARRDWKNSGPDALVPPCVQFTSLGGVQIVDKTKDVIAMYFCPRASEAHLVEEVLAKYDDEAREQLFSVFINPVLVDMGVTGFGMAGRMLRERLIDTIPNAYYLRTLPWGALTRAWPRDFAVWQEDEDAEGGYRLIGQVDRLPSNQEVEDIYDIENNILDDPSLKTGPGTVMHALNAFGDFVQGMSRL